jgi:CelD/BcsL family acetyltransferase involved in cellulose biosynthesis
MATHELLTATLADDWELLADETDAPPFVRPPWVAAWVDAFGGRLVVRTIRRSGALVGVVPLVDDGSVLRSPTNWHTPEFGIVARDDATSAELMSRVVAELRSARRRLDLGLLAPRDEAALRSLATASGLRSMSWVQEESPYIDTSVGWERYLDARDKPWIRRLDRRRARLSKVGQVRLDIHQSRDRLAALLDEGFRLEAAGWKGAAGTAVLSRSDTRSFYESIAPVAADRGWLRLAFLRVGDRAAAFDFCFETGRRHYFMKTGFDPELRGDAPGLLLRLDMIRRSFELGHDSYEMLGGAEPWKLDWTDSVRTRYRWLGFGRSPAAVLDRLAFEHGRPIAKAVVARSRAGAATLQRTLRRSERRAPT